MHTPSTEVPNLRIKMSGGRDLREFEAKESYKKETSWRQIVQANVISFFNVISYRITKALTLDGLNEQAMCVRIMLQWEGEGLGVVV